jgi:precorrin-6B methylase 2
LITSFYQVHWLTLWFKDVFLAAKKVGPKGRVIGIDMTPEMIELAKRNAEKSGYTNVQFIQVCVFTFVHNFHN